MQAEHEQQYNGERERNHQCRSWVQAVSVSVPHRHQCWKLTSHKLAHECQCGYRWNKGEQRDLT